MVTFSLGVAVQAGQMQAEGNSRKTILSKIARSKRGIPCAGYLPFGRKWDKKKWIEEIAKTYLSGNIGWHELGKRFQTNGPNLRRILLKTAGDTWEGEFTSKKFGIHEKVEMKIHPLLSLQMIQKLRGKSKGRMLWERGKILHEYLLNRMIFDAETGKALSGTYRANRYYRLFYDTPNKYAINSNYIEEWVIEEFFRIIQDDESFKKAILQGNSKKGMVDDLKEKKIFYEKELKKGLTKRGKFENMVMDFEGGISRVFSRAFVVE